MSTQGRRQLAEDSGSIVSTGRYYRAIGNILVLIGYLIILDFLLALFFMAYADAEGIQVFWEVVLIPNWPWLLAALLMIIVGITTFAIGAIRRKHGSRPERRPETQGREDVRSYVQPPLEQHVEA